MLNKKNIFIIIFSLIFFCSLNILSQNNEPEDIADINLEDLLNMSVTSASKIEQKAIEAPSVISVITAEQINSYGWMSMNDILYKLPGFGPSQDYDRRTVESRGMFEGWNNNHLLLLIDGIPFNDNLYGTAYTWEITPLTMAKSLEVIRGPGSALYGSNATNGLIQINTVSADNLKGKGAFSSTIGDNGVRKFDFLTGHEADKFSFVMSYSTYDTNGIEYMSYDGSGRLDENNDPLMFETKDKRSSNYFWFKMEGKDTFKDFTLQFHQQEWNFQTGHGWLWWIPDYDEPMHESRRILALTYKPDLESNLSQEYVVRYQKHNIEWNMRDYPDGAFEDFYPSGMWEYLDTGAYDVFFRAQYSYSLSNNSSILFGLEEDVFEYNGDNEHYSNVDLDNTGGPFPGDINTDLGPWLDYILDEKLYNTGLFAQYTSGDIFDKLKVTLGLRFDKLSFDYRKVYDEGMPKASKTFSQVSPRLAVVYVAKDDLSFKFMGGKAFRSPSPTEMAGAHTWSLGSNIEELDPEVITTFEAAVDWIINKNLNWRTNVFHTKFENQIAYSAQNNNLSTNIYTLTSAGIETELLYGYKNYSGFVNLSYVKRLDEEIFDNTIAASPDDVTWAPSLKLNFGFIYTDENWKLSLSGHHQGTVKRRTSDVGIQELPLGVGVSLDMDKYRSRSINSWFTLDSKLSYILNKNIELSLNVTNLLDEKDNFLIKNIGFPFDYQMDGRRYLCSLRISY